MNKEIDYPSDFAMTVTRVVLNKEAGWSLELERIITTHTNKKLDAERERIAELVFNAGENNVSKLCYPDKPCKYCCFGFTGTHWISQNMLYFMLTGTPLNEAKEAIITNHKD